MNKAKGISLSVCMYTARMQLKLRALAKHTEALADELDAIDNTWTCDCGSFDHEDEILKDRNHKIYAHKRKCSKCGECYVLPTRLEGSE